MGSPLELNSIKKKLSTALAFPDAIQGDWLNAYADRNYVALHPLDRRNFDIHPAVINYDRVRNKTSNCYGITGYLNDIEVAKRIYDALR